jgi:hypothetical protein
MNTNKEKVLYKDLSYKIIGLAMEVHNKLGYGLWGSAKKILNMKDLFIRIIIIICVNLCKFVAEIKK